MKKDNQNQKEECPLCKISEETLSILKNEKRKKERVYKCPECGLLYREEKWAKRCESWCKEHKSCNLEIIKHAVRR